MPLPLTFNPLNLREGQTTGSAPRTGTNGLLSDLEALYTDIHAHFELSIHVDSRCGRESTLRRRL